MAGFKNTIISHDPKLFLTFDGDAFDVDRKLTAIPQVFIDESGFNSNIILHNESEDYPAYRMGIPSLVDLEQTDQYSTSFGWYGHQPGAPTRWPKSFIEVQHQSHLTFDDNNGSFTVGFFVNKQTNENAFRNIEQDLGNTYTMTIDKCFVRKAGSFNIYYRDNWGGSPADEIRFTHPGGELTWEMPLWFFDKKNFVVCTWSVTETDPDVWLSEAKIYINGHVYASYSNTTSGFYPGSTSTAPIEIAGNINASAFFNDRATSNTQMDQIFITNSALSSDEICTLFRKSKSYDNLSVIAQATAYWPMTDPEDPGSFVMGDLMNYNDGVYQGGITRVLRQQDAPDQILGGSSVYFHNGGMAIVHRLQSGSYTTLFTDTFTSDFSVDLWVNFSNTDRSVIWACQEDDFPHLGVAIEANRRNNINQPGHIQFSVSQEYQISSLQFQDNGDPYNFNDGRFHHVAVVRKGGVIYLWIDGILHGQLTAPIQPVANPGPGQAYFMGAAPGRLNTEGNMSAVAVYNYALDDAEIRMRNAYALIYRIQGTVTLQGNPHQATVRAYRHRTGELTREILSDSSTGDYLITLYDNSLIDLMVLNKQDPNIRYRVYGPITPALYEDVP